MIRPGTSAAVDATALPPIVRRAALPELGLSKHHLYAMVKAGELEQIAPGYYLRPGELDDTSAACASISLRKPAATICLLSALSMYDLTDEIPRAIDIALPRGERNPIAEFQPIRWHSFDRATFDVGRVEHHLADTELAIGLYSPERTIVDAFRLRHVLGTDVSNEALKRWLRRRGNAPSALLEVARAFPKVRTALRASMEILL
jgi:predicted transcriptional regulator of viral defense system